ncbi:MAG: MFS transporter [Actinomycetia bacterium]|nr:MFS transporter [Actinomycetes bacterium]
MQGPTRIAYAAGRHASIALVGATAAVALMYASTPFLIPVIAERYGVSEGAVGAVSVAQVGAFAAANFILPRLLTPNGRILRIAAAVLLVLNIASAVPNIYGVLVGIRLVAGFAAGAMTWLTWTSAMQERTSMAAVASTGPLTVLIGAPFVAFVAGYGDRAVYILMALATIPAVLLTAQVTGERRTRGLVSRSRSNRILLVALAGATLFGSALFINETLVARDVHGLSSMAASLAFSMNAAGGLLGARLSSRHRRPGWMIASIAPAAVMTVMGPPAFFFIGMTWWGFAFWMSIPGVLQMLSDRSLSPSERAGDAQGLMAIGRSIGPVLGGAFVDIGSLVTLAVVSAVGLTASGAMVIGVQEGREHLPPTDPRTV